MKRNILNELNTTKVNTIKLNTHIAGRIALYKEHWIIL